MGQSQRPSSESVKERSLTVIDSTRGPRLGEVYPNVTIAPYLNIHHSAEIVRWVAESKRPFKIVNDRGFQSLMKTGRPEYYIPSAETVSRDVKKVFVCVRQRIAKMLQVC